MERTLLLTAAGLIIGAWVLAWCLDRFGSRYAVYFRLGGNVISRFVVTGVFASIAVEVLHKRHGAFYVGLAVACALMAILSALMTGIMLWALITVRGRFPDERPGDEADQPS